MVKLLNFSDLLIHIQSEIEETLNRIKTHKAVRGIVVCNAEGKIVRNTFAEGKKEEGENIARTIPPLAIKARNAIRDLDSSVSSLIGYENNFHLE